MSADASSNVEGRELRGPLFVSMPAAAYLAIGVGALIRFRVFMRAPSLWTDEAMLALNIGRRSFVELLQPLGYDQAAPVGYLWAVKAVTLVAGMNELALRFVAAIASVLVLVALWRVGRRLAGDSAALAATVLAAWIFAPPTAQRLSPSRSSRRSNPPTPRSSDASTNTARRLFNFAARLHPHGVATDATPTARPMLVVQCPNNPAILGA